MTVPKTIFLTGATSGIGFELARLYKERQERLLVLGRKPFVELDVPLLEQETYCECDLGGQDAVEQILAFLEKGGIKELDVLIHNAAIGYYGSFEKQSEASILELLEVNLYAPVLLSHALLPMLKKGGKIVFINSIASNLPVADYAVYGATKAALAGFARNLRLEQPDLKVQSIYLGASRTGMHAKSGVPAGRLRLERFPSAEDVAKKVFRAIEAGHSEVTIGFANTLLRACGRYLRPVVDALMRRFA